MKTTALVLCGGKSTRMGGQDKLFAMLGDDPLFMHSVRAFTHCSFVDEVVVVFHSSNMEKARKEIDKYNFTKPVKLILGGEERYISARQGFLAADPGSEIILVHDGARPLVSKELITRVWEATKKYGAIVPTIPVVDTIKETIDSFTVNLTLTRSPLRAAQTPQGFKREILNKAYEVSGVNAHDDAQLAELSGTTVYMVDGDPDNLKVTTPKDFIVTTLLYNERRAV